MINRKAFTIAHTDLFLAMILISTNIQVRKISCEVMSGTRISISVFINKRLRHRKKSLYVGITGIQVIKPMIAS